MCEKWLMVFVEILCNFEENTGFNLKKYRRENSNTKLYCCLKHMFVMWSYLVVLPEMDNKDQQPCTSSVSPGTVDSMGLRLTPSHQNNDDNRDRTSDNGDYENRSECDSLSEIIVNEYTQSEPTSAILSFCQKKFLLPYVNFLGLVGLRPITIDTSDWSACLGHIQTVIIVTLLTTGYFIQCLSCFRRDRGFTNTTFPQRPLVFESAHDYTTYYGEAVFVYGVASVIHFCGFLSAMYVFRIADNEQLQNLVERVFILSNIPNKLFYILWLHIFCGLVWLLLMTLYIILMEGGEVDVVKIFWFGKPTEAVQRIAKVLLIMTTFCQDLVQVTVLTSYSIQCYLLRRYLFILKKKLYQNTIDALDWMREMCEFRKLLSHLNKRIATPVCLFTLLNLSFTFSSTIYFMKIYNQNTPTKVIIMAVVNILLWLILGLYPFFQAASLTYACQSAQSCGHQVRIRPFLHRNTSAEELNSVLLYASSLRMSAKLYHMPIHGSHVFFVMLCIAVVTLTFGMCLNISLGIVN